MDDTKLAVNDNGAAGGEGGGAGAGVADDLDLFGGEGTGDGGEGAGDGGEGAGAGEGESKVEGEGEGEGKVEGEGEGQRKADDKEEPEVREFSALVSGKLRNVIKQAPELGTVLQKYPQVKDLLEATMRRDAAMREIFPTVAEAKALRDQFPHGKADVDTLLEEIKEIEEVDTNYETRDAEGNYSGHVKLIDNFVARDKNAAIALFKTLPKEWARIDKDSYNEVMGKVVAATFASRNIPEFITGLIEDAKVGGEENKGLVLSLERLNNWVNSYFAEKPMPTEAEQRLAKDRSDFDKRTKEETQKQHNTFHQSFLSSAKRLQVTSIKDHRVIKKLETLTSLSKEKKEDIVEKVRTATEQFLAHSPSFMKKLREAHGKGDLKTCEDLQRAAWAQPWLLNRMIRQVMQKEVPQLIQQNRDATQRRAGTQRAAVPAKPGDRQRSSNTPKGPRQIGGRWYREDGTPFTTAEVLSGKHLQA